MDVWIFIIIRLYMYRRYIKAYYYLIFPYKKKEMNGGIELILVRYNIYITNLR